MRAGRQARNRVSLNGGKGMQRLRLQGPKAQTQCGSREVTGKEMERFAFGRNWASYAAGVGARQIDEARACLLKLIPEEELRGRTMLDIGCGSGLHSLAALQSGARVTAIDIDPDSVATTRALLARHGFDCDVSVTDVFEAAGSYDVVYSWGVLHHTGDLWRAMERAASLVRPGGLFAFALYRATSCDAFWTWEKRWYTRATPAAQAFARFLYRAAYRVNCLAKGESYAALRAGYATSRGMDFEHDIRDWLGGHPYQATLAPEVEAFMAARGFKPVRVFALPKGRGLLGSGCDEYVYRAP